MKDFRQIYSEYYEKKCFVEFELYNTAKVVYKNLNNLRYEKNGNGEEFVTARYANGYEKTICVTANSLRAIVLNIFKELH